VKPIYLASPYSHASGLVREERYRAACDVAARLAACGLPVFSPIAHSHPVTLLGGPASADYWQPIDDAILAACGLVLVATIPGYAQSRGVEHEVELARELGIRVEYVAPEEIEDLATAYRETLAPDAEAATA
jgi:hypothetical protein